MDPAKGLCAGYTGSRPQVTSDNFLFPVSKYSFIVITVKRESTVSKDLWIPVFASMTRLFAEGGVYRKPFYLVICCTRKDVLCRIKTDLTGDRKRSLIRSIAGY